jgi:hypothetical protein
LDFLSPVISPTKSSPTLKRLKPVFNPNPKPETSVLNTIRHILETESVFKNNNPQHVARIDSSQKSKPQLSSSTQAKMNPKQVLASYTNTTKNHTLHPKHPYYNIYDADKPVTIKRIQKEEENLPKDKQETLNNTLAVYGLRLDPKGKNVILKDNEEHSGTLKGKHGIEEEIKENEGGNVKITRKNKEKESEKHFKTKNVDTIKSLWSILQNVSNKWK